MRRYIVFLILFVLVFSAYAQERPDTLRHEVMLETTAGNIRLQLYNETPKHRDNFLAFVKKGYYDGNLFHRVIADFMIQTGDSTTRHSQAGERVGMYAPAETIPAEIVFPKYFHKRGSLCAARTADNINPERASSSTQFYIVWGRTFTERQMEVVKERVALQTQGKVQLTDSIIQYYQTQGGTPHLDGQYTVFGEVVDGLNIVDAIQRTPTDSFDRPLSDVRIIRAYIIR